ncbi:hypothetical protein LXA43DRAFT_1099397 [Ganoderma leucocontextum]|nr:hypothetical protein LXA43DRAFT_1099397 [Ganoderma leucocontextum]
MVRVNPRLLGFSTPQLSKKSKSKYPLEVRALCLTGADNRKPYDSGTPQARNCPQCGGIGTVIECLAFREGRAGEWYRCCTQCRNINFPPQPGTPPDVVEAIEEARGNRSARGSWSAPLHAVDVRDRQALPNPNQALRVVWPGLKDFSRACFCTSMRLPQSYQLKKRRREQEELEGIAALNIAGPSKQLPVREEPAKKLRTLEGSANQSCASQEPLKMPRALEALAKKPRTLEVMIKEFLELTQDMGVPVGMASGLSQTPQEQDTQACDADGESTVDTPTPAPRKRKLNTYIAPRVMVAPARASTSVHIPIARPPATTAQPSGDIIEISSDSDDDVPTAAQVLPRDNSVISLTDSEDPQSESDDEGPVRVRKPIIRMAVHTPSDVIELSDSEGSSVEPNASKENTAPSGLDVSTLTRTHHGLVASRSPTCLTDLVASDSSSETTDLFADGAEDGDPYVPRKAPRNSTTGDVQSAGGLTTRAPRSAAPRLSSPEEEFAPFGDPYRFEIYPSLANLADGPLPVFNQATQWMLTVKIWYNDELPPVTKMITLDERRCEIVLAMYHIVRRVFDCTQVYEFRIWNPSTTDWCLHALTAPLEVAVDPGHHTLLIRLPFVTTLAAWPEVISQTYGTCTTVERPARKGKERATD